MLKLLGAILLTTGAAAIGFSAASQLGRRVKNLRALIAALELAERELSFRLTPIPDLLDELSRRAQAPINGFFSRCLDDLDQLGEQSLGQIWNHALIDWPMDLDKEDRTALSELGQVLGRYDGDGQREAIALARARLEQQLTAAEADRDGRGRLYGTLGLAAGGFFVILLL